jgi:hypothetical protein
MGTAVLKLSVRRILRRRAVLAQDMPPDLKKPEGGSRLSESLNSATMTDYEAHAYSG